MPITTLQQWQSLFTTAHWSLYSLPFMVVFIIFFAVYIQFSAQKNRGRKLWVIAFSFFFATMINQWGVVLLPLTTIFSWYLTKQMMLIEAGKKRKYVLAITIILELLPLAYLKYMGFTIEIVRQIFNTNFSLHAIFLPIGISFYTFQAVSYTIDVYRKRFESTCSLLDYTFYLTFFPLLIAGPITRAEVLIPQLRRHQQASSTLIYRGLWLILCGLVKKCVIADYLAQYNNFIFNDPLAYTGFENLMGVIGFSLQIYCDFAGYSDLAIGMAALIGIQLKDNFRFPYQSLNLTEFWHRWHIALSTWFRDYLYIPLGGNRRGFLRTYLNSFIVMIVAGLWHGASWMFVIWGIMHGVGLVAHKYFYNLGLKNIKNTATISFFSWLLTFSYVTLAWIFFRAQDMNTAIAILSQIVHHFSLSSALPFLYTRPLWLFIFLLCLDFLSLREHDYQWVQIRFIRSHWILKLLIFIFVLQLVINISQDNVQPFIYMKF